MIELRRVSKRFVHRGQPIEALRRVSLRVDRGALAFVTGASGAGKSTLLRLIAGIETPSEGTVLVEGDDIGQFDARRRARLRRSVGLIFQDHRLLPDRSIAANVALPLDIAGVPLRDQRRRVDAVLDRVGLLSRRHALPSVLSAGEQQRVGIARAVVHRPDILLADEPTGNLDPGLSEEIMRLFMDFQAHGVTTLIASHDHELIARLGCNVLRLEHGRLRAET